jgi:multiple sugar transport system permease protein
MQQPAGPATFLRLLAALVVCVIVLFPVYWMVMTAIMPIADIASRNPPLLPAVGEASLDSFYAVFERRPFLLWTWNSLTVGCATAGISLVVSVLAGYSLSRWSYAAQRVLGGILFTSKLIPTSLLIIPLFIMFSTMRLVDSLPGLVLAQIATGVPLATWLMKSFFDRIPRELDQAAMIDGCSGIGVLWHIVLPLVRPGIASTGIYLLLVSWSEFIFARTLVSSDEKRVITVGLQSFTDAYSVDWSTLMAAGTLSLIPIAILFVLLEPLLVSGHTRGAVAN